MTRPALPFLPDLLPDAAHAVLPLAYNAAAAADPDPYFLAERWRPEQLPDVVAAGVRRAFAFIVFTRARGGVYFGREALAVVFRLKDQDEQAARRLLARNLAPQVHDLTVGLGKEQGIRVTAFWRGDHVSAYSLAIEPTGRVTALPVPAPQHADA